MQAAGAGPKLRLTHYQDAWGEKLLTYEVEKKS